MKVISFKVEDEIYNKLKSLKISFRIILEPLLVDYLNNLQRKDSIHQIIQKKKDRSYEDVEGIIDGLIEGLNYE